MGKIKIKYFGPIKEGLKENNGFIDLQRLVILIGEQGSGKSTIAKLISTLTWIEKAIFRGDISEKEVSKPNRFENTYCGYQNLQNYFSSKTEIVYEGVLFRLHYKNEKLNVKRQEHNTDNYLLPKIMYVPAERNFISAIKGVKKLKNLPGPLITFLDEYNNALEAIDEPVELPIKNVKIKYQKLNDYVSIHGDDYKVGINEASSGFQSVVPVFLVSKYLTDFVKNKEQGNKFNISLEQLERIRKELREKLAIESVSDKIQDSLLDSIVAKFKIDYFYNIVEEVEQNLYPKSQRIVLNSLLEYANETNNKLLLTTHSPFIISYLTLAVKAFEINNKLELMEDKKKKVSFKTELNNLVPEHSQLNPEDYCIYEVLSDGKISVLNKFENLPSDENVLNHFLMDMGNIFDQLLTIEDGCNS